MVMPRIYRINAERELNQLQNDLLMFQEDEELRRLRSGSCIFERAKKCNHCFCLLYTSENGTRAELCGTRKEEYVCLHYIHSFVRWFSLLSH